MNISDQLQESVSQLVDKLSAEFSKLSGDLREAALGKVDELFSAVQAGTDLDDLGPTEEMSWADILSSKADKMLTSVFGQAEEEGVELTHFEQAIADDLTVKIRNLEVHDGLELNGKSAEDVAHDIMEHGVAGSMSPEANAAQAGVNGAGVGFGSGELAALNEQYPGVAEPAALAAEKGAMPDSKFNGLDTFDQVQAAYSASPAATPGIGRSQELGIS